MAKRATTEDSKYEPELHDFAVYSAIEEFSARSVIRAAPADLTPVEVPTS